MKLQQSGAKTVITSCKDCIFSVPKDDNPLSQIGCEFNRIETFKTLGVVEEAYDNDKEFYLIKRLCNLNRTKSWIKPDREIDCHELDKIQARKEVQPKFGIVILDNEDENSKIDDAIESIKNLDYNPKKIKVVISSFYKNNISYLVTKTEELKKREFRASFVINHNDISQIIEYDAFKKCIGANYLVKMHHDSVLYPEVLNDVDKSLNEKLEQIALFETGNVAIVHFNIANTQYHNHANFDGMVNDLRSHTNMYARLGL